MACPESATGQSLAHPILHPMLENRRTDAPEQQLEVHGADLHNLQNVNVSVPLQRLVCVTGVSGSGKSSLVRGVLHDNLRRLTRKGKGAAPALEGCQGLEGWKALDRVLEVDQTPIGKTPRSCPATLRGLLGQHPQALCRHRGSAPAGLRTRALFLQHQGGSLSGL